MQQAIPNSIICRIMVNKDDIREYKKIENFGQESIYQGDQGEILKEKIRQFIPDLPNNDNGVRPRGQGTIEKIRSTLYSNIWAQSRVYQNWESYIEENILPHGSIVVPRRGIFTLDNEDSVILDLYTHRPRGLSMQAANKASAAVSLGAACVPLAALALPIAPLMACAGIIAIAAGTFSTAIYQQARGSWLGVAGGLIGATTVAATSYMTSATAAGTATAKYKDGDDITGEDVMQLAASLVLFTHSVYNFRMAAKIVEDSRSRYTSNYRNSLKTCLSFAVYWRDRGGTRCELNSVSQILQTNCLAVSDQSILKTNLKPTAITENIIIMVQETNVKINPIVRPYSSQTGRLKNSQVIVSNQLTTVANISDGRDERIVSIMRIITVNRSTKECINIELEALLAKQDHVEAKFEWHEVLKDIYYLLINFAADIHGEENILILDLFGVVTPKLVSHELRGLNVIVRLVKSVHITWPRLLKDARKFSCLSYDYNFIDVREIDGVNPTSLNYKVASDEITDSGSDSEEDLFHTYNRTEKCGDDADPFS
uniref:DUF4781 domain-containing protein n=1 Tax=Glossina austeni TaxID=7395 RepID=A0A1A9VNS5_GLOAU